MSAVHPLSTGYFEEPHCRGSVLGFWGLNALSLPLLPLAPLGELWLPLGGIEVFAGCSFFVTKF